MAKTYMYSTSETSGGDGGFRLAEEESGDREGLDEVGRDDVVEEERVAGSQSTLKPHQHIAPSPSSISSSTLTPST
ncbi:hypothetical protein ACE6H2_001602 [Prunus campanulata]